VAVTVMKMATVMEAIAATVVVTVMAMVMVMVMEGMTARLRRLRSGVR
jgi:hypothetical protein